MTNEEWLALKPGDVLKSDEYQTVYYVVEGEDSDLIYIKWKEDAFDNRGGIQSFSRLFSSLPLWQEAYYLADQDTKTTSTTYCSCSSPQLVPSSVCDQNFMFCRNCKKESK